MCGIAGWLGALPDDSGFAEHMAQALHHRGPDEKGIRSWPEATLVHTRLSIIDLSPAGAQPMPNESGTVWTVFNGEIYNHRELRGNLESRGHVFRGHSDSEVLPHLYAEEGANFITKLRGMFALAIYDTQTRTLILARDRFGIKPLFYSLANNRLVFASEIRALLGFPGVDTRPDRQAIYDLAALFYIPAPETFYVGIRALQPGEMLEARIETDGAILCKNHIYYRWTIGPDSTLTLSEAADRADELVTTAVSRQLESDVPLCALLSGGIDSSLVSFAAQRALGNRLRTFNVRFAEREYDETWAAVAVAKHLGTNHQTLDMDGVRGTWDHVTSLLLHAGQPFADTSLFAVNAICRLMRQHVTVALSGDGGDEGFGGYTLYWRIAWIAQLQRFPQCAWDWMVMIIDSLRSFDLVSSHLSLRLRDLAGADNTTIVQSMFAQLSKDLHRNLCQDTHLLPVRRFFERQWEHYLPLGASRVEHLSAHASEVNIRLHLPNDFLFKVDSASMREGLEVRVPMLDEDLFSFALTLPHYLKVQNQTCKRVLRAVALRRFPRRIANKSKHGFSIPFDVWVDNEFKACLKENLLGRSSRLDEFFRPDVYRRIVAAFCDNQPYRGLSRQGLCRATIMLLSVQLALGERTWGHSESFI